MKVLLTNLTKTNVTLSNKELARDIANKKLREYNKRFYNERYKKLTLYSEGNYILVRQLQKKVSINNKLMPKYEDLFVIVEF